MSIVFVCESFVCAFCLCSDHLSCDAHLEPRTYTQESHISETFTFLLWQTGVYKADMQKPFQSRSICVKCAFLFNFFLLIKQRVALCHSPAHSADGKLFTAFCVFCFVFEMGISYTYTKNYHKWWREFFVFNLLIRWLPIQLNCCLCDARSRCVLQFFFFSFHNVQWNRYAAAASWLNWCCLFDSITCATV